MIAICTWDCDCTTGSLDSKHTNDVIIKSDCPRCGCSGDCSCRWTSVSNSEPIRHTEEEIEPVKEKILYNIPPLLQAQRGVTTRHYMCHRPGSTAKKIKLHTGLNN